MDREALLKAGQINEQAIHYGKTLITVGANTLDVCKQIEAKIRELGGEPAFPAQVSMNEIAAHWCPGHEEERVFEENDLVKLDIGTHINGYIADQALSIDLSKDNRHGKLIQAAEEARNAALEIIKPGITLGEIGARIQEVITQAGYSPVRNLSGHGLGHYSVHTSPSIPNIDTGDATVLEEGMVIAVEPFASTGSGIVKERDHGNIFSIEHKRPTRNPYARKALDWAAHRKQLPFSMWQLAEAIGKGAAAMAMRTLVQEGIAQVYPPLVDTGGGIVAQAEHSIIVLPKPIIYTLSANEKSK